MLNDHLRHTCCTRLLEQGVSLPIVGQILGWAPSATVRMAQRYGHIGQDAQRAAMALLDAPKAQPAQPPAVAVAETVIVAQPAIHCQTQAESFAEAVFGSDSPQNPPHFLIR
jgi:hypothetical protein